MFNPHFKRDAIECIYKHCKRIDQVQYQVYISENIFAIHTTNEYSEPIYESSWEDLVKLILRIAPIKEFNKDC